MAVATKGQQMRRPSRNGGHRDIQASEADPSLRGRCSGGRPIDPRSRSVESRPESRHVRLVRQKQSLERAAWGSAQLVAAGERHARIRTCRALTPGFPHLGGLLFVPSMSQHQGASCYKLDLLAHVCSMAKLALRYFRPECGPWEFGRNSALLVVWAIGFVATIAAGTTQPHLVDLLARGQTQRLMGRPFRVGRNRPHTSDITPIAGSGDVEHCLRHVTRHVPTSEGCGCR